MKKYKASVIIVTHNQSRILALQIAALENQKHINTKEDFEVIVTDDSSSAEELIMIKKFLDESTLNILLITQNTPKYWAAKARNNAIKKATGDILIFLDGDMVPENDVISRHLEYHQNYPNTILAGHRIRKDSISESNIYLFWEFCRKQKATNANVLRWQKTEERQRREYLNSSNPWKAIFSCHMSIRATKEVLFDENFKGWGPEDWELAYRLTKKTKRNIHFASDIIAYEIDELGDGASNVFRNKSSEAIIDYLRNTIYFFDKCPGLNLEEVFWGFRKIHLSKNDTWVITPSNPNCDLASHVEIVRQWLVKHNIN